MGVLPRLVVFDLGEVTCLGEVCAVGALQGAGRGQAKRGVGGTEECELARSWRAGTQWGHWIGGVRHWLGGLGTGRSRSLEEH